MQQERPKDESKYNGKVCPIDSKKCDHKCGYPAHGRIIRKNRCASCEGGMDPVLINEVWDKLSFVCDNKECNRYNIITKIYDEKNK